MTTPTGKVAFTASLPVDVLMKSAPAIIATWLARATFASVARSPVPRITFMCAAPHAARKARTSSYTASQSPASAWARVMTTSISSAPAATEALISSIRWGRGLSPAGNPVDTAATGMPEPWSAWTATGTKAWYRHTAPTLIPKSVAPSASSRSGRTGLFALAHSRTTLVGVSSPWSVVKSMQVMARSNQAACHSFLTVRRVGMVAARRSTALRLMCRARTRSRSRGMPGLRPGSVNTRSARSDETGGATYLSLVSMAASNLRRLSLLRRVPLGLAILAGPLFRCRSALRLLRLGLRARWRRGRYPFGRRSLRPGCLVFFGRGCGRGRRHGPLGARRWSCRPLRGLGLLRGSLPLRRLRVLPRLRSLLAGRAGGTLDRGGRRPCRVTCWSGLTRGLRLGDAWWDRPRWGETLAGGPQRGGGGGGGGTLRPDRARRGCGAAREALGGVGG